MKDKVFFKKLQNRMTIGLIGVTIFSIGSIKIYESSIDHTKQLSPLLPLLGNYYQKKEAIIDLKEKNNFSNLYVYSIDKNSSFLLTDKVEKVLKKYNIVYKIQDSTSNNSITLNKAIIINNYEFINTLDSEDSSILNAKLLGKYSPIMDDFIISNNTIIWKEIKTNGHYEVIDDNVKIKKLS